LGAAGAIALGGVSAKADFVFGEPVNLGPIVNGSYDDFPSCISADGLELYISSSRPGSLGAEDLWITTRVTREDEWTPPVNLGPTVNSSAKETIACISADGLELYFEAWNHPGGYGGGWDIWVSRRQTRDDPWSPAVNLGPPINTSSWDGTPSISADGLELYFASNRAGGQGTDDLWVAQRATKDDPWAEPVNLGSTVNSSARECCEKISADSLLLVFSGDCISPYRSGGFGLSDIWVTTRAGKFDAWKAPENLGPLVNSSFQDWGPVISREGDTLYFTSNRPGGYGGDDIWKAPIIPIVDLNGDGKIDGREILTMADHWGTDDSLCDIGPTPFGDGIVDVEDLKVVAKYIDEEVDDPTLVAHWKLDESEGMTADDSAGVNDGTVMGVPAWQPDGGKVGGALEFDGASAFVVTDCVVRSADGPFSILAWIKGGGPGQVVISQQAGGDWLYANQADGSLATECAGRVNRPLLSDAVITDDQWHRIGITWDGSHRRLYVDGEEVATDTQDGLASSDGGLILGSGSHLTNGTFFTGLIDDVRIYNRAVKP